MTARLVAELRQGRLDVSAAGLPLVSLCGAGPEVTLDHGGRDECWAPALRDLGDQCFESEPGPHGLVLRLRVEPGGDGLVVRFSLRHQGATPVRLGRVAPLAGGRAGACRIGSGADRWSVFRQGYQSWTGTRSFRASDTDRDPRSHLLRIGLVDIRRPAPARRGHFRSDQFAAVKNLRSGEALVAGFLDARTAFGDVEVRVVGDRCTRFAAGLDYDGVALAPGEEVSGPPLWLGAAMDEHALLAAYAAAVGEHMGARVPARNPVGWCSWYYYFTRISEALVLENLEALARLRAVFPCDYVQIDDGYQAAVGDWLTPNAKFPHGMAWIAERIRSAGFDAGLWTAPFIARSDARLFAEHPDWFVQTRRGRPRFALWNPVWGAGRACYALDTTHPEVLEWLRETFRVIAHDWGFRVLKLDFLFGAALPGRRWDPGATRAAALRRGLEAVREGAGEDAFLLGCGCPLGPAVGIADAMRIGPDVAPFWSNALSRIGQRDLHGLATKNAVRNTLTRAFLHRRWWLNDPDCLMVRDTRTRLTPEEVRSLATAIAVTDGMIVLSDRVQELSPERLEVLRRTLALGGGRPEAIDLMEADIPELVVSRGPGRAVVAAFNFGAAARRGRVDLAALGIAAGGDTPAAEHWTGMPVPVADGVADMGDIPPHGCRVLVLPGPE